MSTNAPAQAPALIRAFVPDDAEGVARLVSAILREHGFTSKIEGATRDLLASGAPSSDVLAAYRAPAGAFWVAEEEGAIVGTVAIRAKGPSQERTCELKRLYVRADHRGEGLGERLYQQAEAFARRAGYSRIALDSSRRFDKAHRLYVRHGFTLTGRLDNDWEDDVFEKQLVG